MNKEIVTISRYWDNPKIEVSVNQESIGLKISLDDFIKLVKNEIGSITFVFKQDTFNSMLDNAIKNILEKIKEESVKAV